MEAIKLIPKHEEPKFKDGGSDETFSEGMVFGIEIVSNGYILFWEEVEDGETYERKSIFHTKEELLEELDRSL